MVSFIVIPFLEPNSLFELQYLHCCLASKLSQKGGKEGISYSRLWEITIDLVVDWTCESVDFCLESTLA